MAKTLDTNKKTSGAAKPRQLKEPKYKSFQLSKRIAGKKLPTGFGMLKTAFGVLVANWPVVLGLVVIYGLLNALLVQGFSAAGDLGTAKSTMDSLFTGDWGQLFSGVTVFVYLLGASGNTASPTAGAYQLILTLIVSLALIWALRQIYGGHKVRVRDAFYRGMAPLVQFVLVLLVIGLQLIPMVLGLFLYNVVAANGIAATPLEQVLWVGLVFVLTLVSLYMVSSSIFALYIVTLPDMTPMKALRSARQLVANRRWAVIRKIVFLPVSLIILAGLIVVPIILFMTPVAAWVFFALSMLLLPTLHGYMYVLYRSML